MSLLDLTRSMVNRLLFRSLPGPFLRESGKAWLVPLPALAERADTPSAPHRSTLMLYEDGVPLQPAHSLHEDVRSLGGGRYSHWEGALLFSTRDNTDPNTNGRRYAFTLSPWLYARRSGFDQMDARIPVNHRKRDASARQVERDVAYALNNGRRYRDAILQSFPSLTGLNVLEVGPGVNYGSALVLGALGARPMVADRFLAPWDPGYHPRFHARLRAELARCEPSADLRPLDRLLSLDAYDDEAILRLECPIEAIAAADGSIDVICSNAVLEHVYDVPAAAAQLARITRPGGIGLHQVDFRDHRDFEQPLEYLLLSDPEFGRLYDRVHGECGNRRRPPEFEAAFGQAGFTIVDFKPNLFCTPEYLNALLPRLHTSRSPYSHLTAAELHVLSGFYRLQKPIRETA